MTFIETRAMEWMNETILIDLRTTRESLESMFAERIRSLRHGSNADLLVKWTISGAGPLVSRLRRGSSAANCWSGCGSSMAFHRPSLGALASSWKHKARLARLAL